MIFQYTEKVCWNKLPRPNLNMQLWQQIHITLEKKEPDSQKNNNTKQIYHDQNAIIFHSTLLTFVQSDKLCSEFLTLKMLDFKFGSAYHDHHLFSCAAILLILTL